MYLSPLQLSSNSQIFLSGDVVVNEGVAIAPGVILQADPGSRISIAAGACIGMGVILHAREGTLEIEAGAMLGAGVLVVGAGKIGANACIGAGTTLINPAIDQMQILPAGSLIGDTSRRVAAEPTAETAETAEAQTAAPETPTGTTPPVEPTVDRPIDDPPEPAQTQPQTPPETAPDPSPETAANPPPQPGEVPTILYGQAHINQLLGTLFPHRQAFNRSQDNGQTLSGGTG
ncbi:MULTISPECIES: carbon dioxide concentrating mechanism protein [unclassified Microcoleus]|uniref:carbon dioxide concentrating mechanism protein n=1 Tax=unclassified Microcoleus TaxID=2642155 RepID=UPI001DFACF96|nr:MULTISPECIES: carbon dioxide concentrating mechanism protein [unclassified Microcoleus]MCC3443062.1 carbon dioxide concentrating mechanism protein [Microcoleus sp. PH2017_03_ELD_O_A]MCC3465450.1 carbon dioxide concentrating mechanism protein [Microcoleus sp. PH2017_06_SFM_O_A]TAE16277.1 MAG: carbon dioxide concentrating mechanism protein [Oscillatoriales cyanobacterium]MCC3411264.1 carbon dioxide concentrating mechanism protein [Microcoleus sp. PH2017_02_FOX_O_A]MCC3489541.1 carbon dioxide 